MKLLLALCLALALCCQSALGQTQTIAEIASGNANLSTLVQALGAANLVDTFQGPGTFTVFAPTNAAFDKLPAGKLAALLADPAGDLTKVLTYHVLANEVDAAAAVAAAGTSVTTLEGSGIAVSVSDGSVYLNGNVKVVTTDIKANNGIIHLVDTVLMPTSAQTIAEIASGNANLSTLVQALGAANLVDTFQGPGTFTVFAPTNAAFASLPAGTLDALLADPAGDLTKVLTYHVLANEVDAAAAVAAAGTSVTTLEGSGINVAVMDGSVYLNGNVKVVTTDIKAKNGIIHVVDRVMRPTSMMNIAQIAAAYPNLSTLVQALFAANLVNTFQGPGTYTVFAPTNAAFDKLPTGALAALLADPAGDLTKVLTYHVLANEVDAAAAVAAAGTSVTTLEGSGIAVSVSDGSVYLNGNVRVTMTDLKANNGIVHVIDTVLVPESVTIAVDVNAAVPAVPAAWTTIGAALLAVLLAVVA